MKVIKYGPGYEPKRITCDTCKSELEYIGEDIEFRNSKVKYNDDYKIMFLTHITCPACKTWIELSRELIDIPDPPSPPSLRTKISRRTKYEN